MQWSGDTDQPPHTPPSHTCPFPSFITYILDRWEVYRWGTREWPKGAVPFPILSLLSFRRERTIHSFPSNWLVIEPLLPMWSGLFLLIQSLTLNLVPRFLKLEWWGRTKRMKDREWREWKKWIILETDERLSVPFHSILTIQALLSPDKGWWRR